MKSTHVDLRDLILRTTDGHVACKSRESFSPTLREGSKNYTYIRRAGLKGCVAQMGLVRHPYAYRAPTIPVGPHALSSQLSHHATKASMWICVGSYVSARCLRCSTSASLGSRAIKPLFAIFKAFKIQKIPKKSKIESIKLSKIQKFITSFLELFFDLKSYPFDHKFLHL